jgi:hypothetical protein
MGKAQREGRGLHYSILTPSIELLKKPRRCHPERSEGSAFGWFSTKNSRRFAALSMTVRSLSPTY